MAKNFEQLAKNIVANVGGEGKCDFVDTLCNETSL